MQPDEQSYTSAWTKSSGKIKGQTSYVKVPPEEVGWRRVTFEMVPFAESMHMARDPCWEKDITFIVTSYNNQKEYKNTSTT